jgi:hypothetical protein
MTRAYIETHGSIPGLEPRGETSCSARLEHTAQTAGSMSHLD